MMDRTANLTRVPVRAESGQPGTPHLLRPSAGQCLPPRVALAPPFNTKTPAGNSDGGLSFFMPSGYRLAARPTQK